MIFGVLGAIATVYFVRILPSAVHVIDYTQANLWLMGIYFGLGALVGDLVGSFIKRRVNIAPGKTLWVIDQIDWIVGAVIAFNFMVDGFDLVFMVYAIVFFGLIHILVNYIGYLMGIKENKF